MHKQEEMNYLWKLKIVRITFEMIRFRNKITCKFLFNAILNFLTQTNTERFYFKSYLEDFRTFKKNWDCNKIISPITNGHSVGQWRFKATGQEFFFLNAHSNFTENYQFFFPYKRSLHIHVIVFKVSWAWHGLLSCEKNLKPENEAPCH